MRLHDIDIDNDSIDDGCCNFTFFGFPSKPKLVQTPKREVTVAEIESELTKDLTHMRIEDRERILEDLHGIANVEDEDPERLERGLYELNMELERKKRGTSYELAESLNREYVQDRKFRIMFLRADDMDASMAADRMIKFFDNKKHLFGVDLLTKDIRLKDLDEYDMEALMSGFASLAPNKDRAGRPIIVFVPGLAKYQAIENMMRAHYYFFMSFLQEEQAQIRGITGVTFVVGNPHVDGHMFYNCARMGMSFPVKFMANHLCYDRIQHLQAMTMVLMTMPRASQQRSRVHTGAHMECRYKLLSFGIPADSLPVGFDGNPTNKTHREWLQRCWDTEEAFKMEERNGAMMICSSRRTPSPGLVAMEDDSTVEGSIISSSSMEPALISSSESSPVSYMEPSQLDVVFGRGKGFQNHDGNVRFHRLLDVHLQEYDKCSKLDKTRLSESILKIIQASNGRFLRQDQRGKWEEVDDCTAREKISRAFRARRSAGRNQH